jgi:threonine efflux protein
MAAGMAELAAFAGILALGQFSPGPDMLLLTQTALARGRRAGWWTTAGITCGLTVHAVFALTALDWIARQQSGLWLAMQAAAGIYLLWLAWQVAHSPLPAAGAGPRPDGGTPARWFRRGLFCNLLNPKALLFFGSLVTPFLGAGRPPWWPWALGTVLVAEGLLLWGLWVVLLQAAPVRRAYAAAARGINLAFAGLMALLALRLLAGAAGLAGR